MTQNSVSKSDLISSEPYAVQMTSPVEIPDKRNESNSSINKSPSLEKVRQLSGSHLNFEVDLVWENLTYEVRVKGKKGEANYKPLIYNLSGRAKAGRVLAIMGPSGAGKTTFLGCITGSLSNSSAVMKGCCFLNNTVYQQRYKALTSFVCQDDIVMCKDTPREAINFSARLRLGVSKEEANQRVEEVIERLHLTKCQHTYLGLPGILKGVSGGERKRTNIGAELVTNPVIMMLDEPTTGLDSVNALRVGQLLQDLAKNDRRTVITTVHSPSSELFELFDDLFLLAKGHTIYHGPAVESVGYFASIGYQMPPHTNPSEYFMNLMQLPEEMLSQLWLAWEDHVASKASAGNPCLEPITGPIWMTDPQMEALAARRCASMYLQFYMLMARAFRMFFRDTIAFRGRAIQTVIFALFFGLFFFNVKLNQQGVQDREGALYMILVSGLFSAISAGVTSFTMERAVFMREQANSTYNTYIFFITKTLSELPCQVLFPTVLSVIGYFMMHFYRSAAAFFSFWLIIVLFANVGSAFGLMLSSFFKDVQAAFALMPAIMLPLFITAGMFSNTARLAPYWEWLMYISFPRHAYVGAIINEFSRLKVICDPISPTCVYPDGDSVIRQLGFTDWRLWKTYVSLTCYYVGLMLIGATSLQIQGMKQRGKMSFIANAKNRVATPRAWAAAREKGLIPREDILEASIRTPSVAYDGGEARIENPVFRREETLSTADFPESKPETK
ncbi:unnamed protein product [Phytomonas sp. EM1]|nr:unnamed protein product [Phytomonas sp. EM1]|eukprot:CCW65741.1 unnamed protein product [Phytomonas sp. isolate EM1]